MRTRQIRYRLRDPVEPTIQNRTGSFVSAEDSPTFDVPGESTPTTAPTIAVAAVTKLRETSFSLSSRRRTRSTQADSRFLARCFNIRLSDRSEPHNRLGFTCPFRHACLPFLTSRASSLIKSKVIYRWFQKKKKKRNVPRNLGSTFEDGSSPLYLFFFLSCRVPIKFPATLIRVGFSRYTCGQVDIFLGNRPASAAIGPTVKTGKSTVVNYDVMRNRSLCKLSKKKEGKRKYKARLFFREM